MSGWTIYMLVVAGWVTFLLYDSKDDPEMKRMAQQCPFCFVAGMSILAMVWPALLAGLIWEWIQNRRS